MNRRVFLRAALLTGAGVVLPSHVPFFSNHLFAAEKPDLTVAHGTPPAKITRAAIDALGGIRRFISRGDVVVVKPNIGWDRTPEYAATTNPEVVATLVTLCYEAGAKKVKVFDRTCSNAQRCYKQSGIADAARIAGAEVSFIDEQKYREMNLGGSVLKTWPIYTGIVEADKIINVPIAKHHGLSTLTLGMKNWMGVMGGSRGRIHQQIDVCLVDLARFLKPALIVLDAVRILTANGPQGGDIVDVRQLNTIVAGTDQVAIDAYGTTLFGMKENTLAYVRLGHQAGLGQMNLSRLKIRKLT